jgi:ATP-binding cassette, subfamily C (CFTR/MRP), member 1
MNPSGICLHEADDRFGPRVYGCRDNFDFTLLFEQSILSLGPSALLLIFSLGRTLQLHRRKVKTVPSHLRIGKTVSTA